MCCIFLFIHFFFFCMPSVKMLIRGLSATSVTEKTLIHPNNSRRCNSAHTFWRFLPTRRGGGPTRHQLLPADWKQRAKYGINSSEQYIWIFIWRPWTSILQNYRLFALQTINPAELQPGMENKVEIQIWIKNQFKNVHDIFGGLRTCTDDGEATGRRPELKLSEGRFSMRCCSRKTSGEQPQHLRSRRAHFPLCKMF